MRDQLIGYLLDALEPHERQQLEERLEQDPDLQRELELFSECVEPLHAADGPIPLPAGLADRTCRMVLEHDARRDVAGRKPGFVGPAVELGEHPSPSTTGRAKAGDLLVAAGIVAAAAMLVLPALQHSRQTARRLACQNNLRRIAVAMAQYTENNGGYLPAIPPDATAGFYALQLQEGGYISGSAWNQCPGAETRRASQKSSIPTLQQYTSASPAQRVQYERSMGGAFGFTLHYVEGGRYRCTRVSGRSTHPIMSDAPCFLPAGIQSRNHGGSGQNVLYEDGHVRYTLTCTAGGNDHIFVNDHGMVAAGSHRGDAVIGSSEARPLVASIALPQAAPATAAGPVDP